MRDVFFTVFAFFYLLHIHYHETLAFAEEKKHHRLQFHSYAKKIDSESTINYLFWKRSLFLFALYTLLKKMLNQNYSISE